MTMHEQVALYLVLIFGGVLGLFWLVDTATELLEDHFARAKKWGEIDRRLSRENHPSSPSKIRIYNWEVDDFIDLPDES